jgi:hypothetical protein
MEFRQSTAATMRVGPFMDATNGVTPETGVTLSGADQAELLKHSGATVTSAAQRGRPSLARADGMT